MVRDLRDKIEQLAVELTRQRSIIETPEERFITEKVHQFSQIFLIINNISKT